ncbi:hypothetical protein LTR50_001117 [Elasticomyces elasticus]|nr:hypothetical protein LTR50_001117 [Elasticomyces elasticus]
MDERAGTMDERASTMDEIKFAVPARPATITPASHRTSSGVYGDDSARLSLMPNNCQRCFLKKSRCDRTTPACSRCSEAEVDCLYLPLSQRQPKLKRKRSENVHERLAGYKRTLQEHGLLSTADRASPSYKETPRRAQGPSSLRTDKTDMTRTGELLSAGGKSRYIDSKLWRDLRDISLLMSSDDEEDGEDQGVPAGIRSLPEDPFSGALLGTPQTLVYHHPRHEDAMKLWAVHVQNVEPLCKILHIPSTARMVLAVSQQPETASKADECLLFAIYHFAVFSMTDEDCVRDLRLSRTTLMSKYQYAARQALVNASWLKTTEMPVMQACVLLLIAMRTQTDIHTFWILTGIGVRIAQRMGLHRDGETLGLPPFDIQMRRRLFWQLVPLDAYAGQVSGTGISIAPNSWDTKQPLNVNDDQIYPGMTQQPEEQKGATGMVFCLMKTELSNLYTRTGVKLKEDGATMQLRDGNELEKLIDEVESSIETKYLRYCNIVDPLHLLTLAIARSATNTARLRNRTSRLMNQTVGDEDRRELCVLAYKILDTDGAAYTNPNIRMFQWRFAATFLWDALICILTSLSLAKIDFFSRAELDTAWSKIADVYSHHQEILAAKGALHAAVGKVTLKAWTTNPPSDCTPEPAFITTLRSQRETRVARRSNRNSTSNDVTAETLLDSPFTNDGNALLGSFDGLDQFLDDDNVSSVDWTFWHQLIRDYHPMPDQQQQQ